MKNKVVVTPSPMGSRTLKEINDKGWKLLQVVAEQYEHYKKSSGYNNIDKIFYKFRYHHYFEKAE